MPPPSPINPQHPVDETDCPASELRQLLDVASDLLVSAEADGRIRFLNTVGCEVLGYSSAEAARLRLHDIVEPAQHAALDESLARTLEGALPRPVALTLLARGRHQIHLHGQFHRHHGEDGSTAIFGVFRDGDGTSGWQESLAEQQIIQNVAREKELTELKSHFISMASHELRTPLAALSLGVDFLSKYWPKLPPDQINKNLKSVDATVRQLRSVLDDVLIISRDEEGQLRCKRSMVELVAFVRKVAEESESADQHRHMITVHTAHERCEAEVDPQLLGHILANLLSNACKYSPAETAVDLTLRREGPQIVIEIADHGIGIPVEDQSKLFGLFFRGSNVGTIAGTGLGLVVVRRCVEAHGGSITVESKPDQGTHFIVALPAEGPL